MRIISHRYPALQTRHNVGLVAANLNLSSGFPTNRVSNQSPQLQGLARKFTCGKFTYDTFHKANNKGVGQTARMYSQTPEDRFSRVEAHVRNITKISHSYQTVLKDCNMGKFHTVRLSEQSH